jgi:hypothetical protein
MHEQPGTATLYAESGDNLVGTPEAVRNRPGRGYDANSDPPGTTTGEP